MLGIDFSDNSIRVVHLTRRGSGFALLGVREMALAPEQSSDPAEIGRLLADVLSQADWQDEKAVMTLPSRFCFIRYFPMGMLAGENGGYHGHLQSKQAEVLLDRVRQSMMAPTEQLVFDFWVGPTKTTPADTEEPGRNYGVLVGAAQQSAVWFCRDLAAAVDIKVQGLELRSLAAINGLLLHWHETPEENIAAVYLESNRADVAIINPEGIVSLPSVNLSVIPSEADHRSPFDELVRHLRRIFNTAKLTETGSTPQRLFLGGYLVQGSVFLKELARQIKQELNLEVTLCSSWEGLLQNETRQNDLSRYIPALGAALDGLEASPTWFNFFQPRGARLEKKHYVTWRPFALAAISVVFILCAFWFYLVQQKKHTLQDLNNNIARLTPTLENTRQAREKWNLFHSFVPALQGGARLKYLSILAEISRLFPSTESAYVTRLIITDKNTDEFDITITGYVREPAVFTDFTNKLEASQMFQDLGWPGTEQKYTNPNHPYPYYFTLTCNLRRFAVIEN